MTHRLLFLAIFPLFANAQNTLQFGPASEQGQLQNINDIALIINEEAISRSQLANELNAAQATLPKEVRLPEQEKGKVLLERVIMQHLVKQLAEKAKLNLTAEEIDKALANIAAQNGVSISQLLVRVKRDTGMNEAQYRDLLREQLVQAQLKERVVGDSINITSSQIDDQLAQIARQRGSVLHLQDLLMPIPNLPINERGPAIDKNFSALSNALKNNDDDLAQAAVSIGAQFKDLGEVNIAKIPPQFARAIVGLSAGEMLSTPVIDADGMHFLKVVSKTAQGQQGYVVPEAKLAHILIRRHSQNPLAAKREIDQIYSALQHGANFADLARQYSQDPASAAKGGELGWMSADSVDPRFAKQLENVPVGQLSAPFESTFGWHIIYVEDRRNVDRSEARIREQIRETLYQTALEDAWTQRLLELRESAYVEIR
ncbi:peptidylprolyl isomerase [Suttonella ornithocola]|uniref:Peptidyl-prolyl cis-trans isomerase surA n=1 Tax=Suttonella ornithocola TaxID=279832 RepID=A0A380MRX7_9GAMM|nr:peptidylprolyl isomerase [Suttonella ornithocola]SUO94796.1 Peptidyl-prolyl cis-trans isomerase surA [Suttonella ornithocola]